MSATSDKAKVAIDILSDLILSHGGMLGGRQHRPSHPDSDDEYMKACEQTMRELRDIRERLENLVAGVVK